MVPEPLSLDSPITWSPGAFPSPPRAFTERPWQLTLCPQCLPLKKGIMASLKSHIFHDAPSIGFKHRSGVGEREKNWRGQGEGSTLFLPILITQPQVLSTFKSPYCSPTGLLVNAGHPQKEVARGWIPKPVGAFPCVRRRRERKASTCFPLCNLVRPAG